MNARLFFICSLLASSSAWGQAVQLITAAEAGLKATAPDAVANTKSRAITRGPGVKLASSDKVSGNFALKVGFEPRGESKIDLASVKVEYLKGAGIDLTERVKASIKPSGIDISAAAAPAGVHPIRVTVRDTEGRQGSADFKLTVK